MRTHLVSLAAMLLIAAAPVTSASTPTLAGQKIDSGLGELPHFSTWADPSGRQATDHRVLGESQDNGLGELPHYSRWIDPTGRDPLGREVVRVSDARR